MVATLWLGHAGIQPMLWESVLVEEFDDKTEQEGQEAEEDADAGQGGWVEDTRGSYRDWKRQNNSINYKWFINL